MSNCTISLTLLLLTSGAIQLAYTQAETVIGSVVRYDASMSSRTSQADLILKVKRSGDSSYTRLRYAPNGFGFDAPPAKSEQLTPKEMFSDGALVWAFRVHTPRNREEKSACTGHVRQYAPGERGQLMEVQRFVSVPGREKEKIPDPQSLPCSIIESWTKKNDLESKNAVSSLTPTMP